MPNRCVVLRRAKDSRNRHSVDARDEKDHRGKFEGPEMPALVIEDDPALRSLLETILGRRGIATRMVGRGDDALKAIFEGTYDAIVLDLLLPGLSGVELLRALREKEPRLLSRVVVITAVANSALQNFAAEFGNLIWQVIRKPFDIDEIATSTLDCMACHSGQM